ncbi:hypothetical protein [Comamonas sp. 26]|uniref:hypothetical protein n=1 Tax=Comamonas sp. 26 TaxID=2035201 RepID=UPI000C592B23|nr:hypothetical protein [Comamonas sp. 26]PIG09390.1 hypothetical protein CLU84_2294 [Comamonas sp. 26]
MKNSSAEISRRMLRPLLRRRAEPANDGVLQEAMAQFEERAIATSLLPHMADLQKAANQRRTPDRWKDPNAAVQKVELSLTLYRARKISLQEYVFHVAHVVEGVHEGRFVDSRYPSLQKLSDEMQMIEANHGLKPGEYWPKSDAPPCWQALSARWDSTCQMLLAQTFAELEGGLASDLFTHQRREFDRLRERGRRALFHKKELIPSLADTVKRYEIEARAAAGANAYTAAVTLIGAALEGLLLLRCLSSPKKSSQVAQLLPSKKRPKQVSVPSTWTFDNLIQVCLAAGWLPKIENQNMSVDPSGLADLLRRMRNNVHPGRVCTESPWVETELRDFEDAELIYATLFARVFRGHMFKQLRERLGEHVT